MSRVEQKEKSRKNHSVLRFSIFIFILTSIFLIYTVFLLGPIEPVIRYAFIGALVVIDILKIMTKKGARAKKKIRRSIFFNFFFSLIFVGLGLFIYMFYSSVNNLNKSYTTYSSSLVVLTDSSMKNISDFSNQTLGMLNDKSSYEGYKIPMEALKKEKLSSDVDVNKYNDYYELVDALYNKKVEGVFLPTNYVNLFSTVTGYEDIASKTKVIYTKEKKVRKMLSISSRSKMNKPITVLLTGIDSNVDGLDQSSSSNSDTLIVVTFNPKTLSATMLSIPRDSYVPVSCFNGNKTKITHAGWQGVNCVETTIEDFLDIDIDYYVKINFKGLVELVDSLGGIDVDVPQDLCTDSSDRTGEVCISEGHQHLNGEEALVLARNRKQLAAGDLDRGLNQQIVVKGILNAVSSNITNVNALKKVLDSLSRNMDTNLSTNQILSFYNVGKDILKKSNKNATDSINITQLFLNGSGVYMYDNGSKMDLYYYALYKDSVEQVSRAMKINLGKEQPKMIKKFSFSIDEKYIHVPLGQKIDNFSFLYYTGTEARAPKKEEIEDNKTVVEEEKTDKETDQEDNKDDKEKTDDEDDKDKEKDTGDDKEKTDDEEDALSTVLP